MTRHGAGRFKASVTVPVWTATGQMWPIPPPTARRLAGDANDESRWFDLGIERRARTDRFAIQFPWMWPFGLDGDLLGTEALDPHVGTASSCQNVHRDAGPVDQAPRSQDHHIKLTIVRQGIGEQRNSALDSPNVADDDQSGPAVERHLVVEAHRHLHDVPEQMPEAGDEVRRPAHTLFEPLGGTR